MAFDNSPKLDNPSKPIRTFSGWVAILRRPVLLGLTTLLVLFCILWAPHGSNIVLANTTGDNIQIYINT